MIPVNNPGVCYALGLSRCFGCFYGKGCLNRTCVCMSGGSSLRLGSVDHTVDIFSWFGGFLLTEYLLCSEVLG